MSELLHQGAPEDTVYEMPHLPTGPFMIRVKNGGSEDNGFGEGNDYIDGPYDSDNFVSDDANVTYTQTDGSPLFLRTTRQDGNCLWTLDGAGKEFKYELIPAIQEDQPDG